MGVGRRQRSISIALSRGLPTRQGHHTCAFVLWHASSRGLSCVQDVCLAGTNLRLPLGKRKEYAVLGSRKAKSATKTNQLHTERMWTMTTQRPIKAEPTKDFFIEVLTRDIQLGDALIDLVDNSIDAAQSIVGPDGDLNDFDVHLSINNDSFTIADTCGGIAATNAANYAFRFGRLPESPRVDGSIGQFGVGMKRALFKLGTAFKIQSQTKDTFWSMSVDVDDWRDDPDWAFSFAEEPVDRPPDAGTRPGTTITVTRLHNETRTQFQQRDFIETLKTQIGLRTANFIERGLVITVNEWSLTAPLRELAASEDLHPLVADHNLADEESELPVKVHIVAGVGRSEPREAGWYIYCNGRLVLGADRSRVTGWGLTDEERMPSYHNQYAQFRGYASFFSTSAAALPWNTTKSNLDQGHPAYLIIRPRMIEAARPVIDFLNALKDERDEARLARDEGTEAPDELKRTVESASQVKLETLEHPTDFMAPIRYRRISIQAHAGPPTQSIQFSRPVKQINNLKRIFGVRSASAVGERCFEYVYEEEIEDDA